jgi:carbonic anhydrase
LINGVGFSYSSQQRWGGACGSGNRQSPIDITIRNSILCPKDKVMLNRINLTSTSINPQGIDLTVAYQGRSTMTFLDSGVMREFDSAQFHWHSPSEHTINGRSFDL